MTDDLHSVRLCFQGCELAKNPAWGEIFSASIALDDLLYLSKIGLAFSKEANADFNPCHALNNTVLIRIVCFAGHHNFKAQTFPVRTQKRLC